MVRRSIYAFTLIELMIVIAIIGILAAISVPNFVQARSEAKLSACRQNIKNLAVAIEMLRTEQSKYVAAKNSDWYFKIDDHCVLVESGILKSVPTCPVDGSCYMAHGLPPNNCGFKIVHSKMNLHASSGIYGQEPSYNSKTGLEDVGTY